MVFHIAVSEERLLELHVATQEDKDLCFLIKNYAERMAR